MKKNVIFNTAFYIRLSKEDGDKEESDSIGNQRKMLMEYIKGREELVLYDAYVDDGCSGTNFNRPGFRRMMQDIEKGIVNCVIVKDLSRFGRDYIDTGKYLERYFPDKEVRFVAVTDNIDSFKHSYDMLLPIKNVFNEQYAAEIVRRIFGLYVNGYGKVKIAHILNEEEVPCPSEYKKLSGEHYSNCNRLEKTFYWTYSTINFILKNEMYVGNMVQGKTKRRMKGKAKPLEQNEWIVVKCTHDPIINEELWNKSQLLLKCRTRDLDLTNNVSVFAGYLVCGDCGRAMAKKYALHKGIKYYRYSCGTYTRLGKEYCSSHTIPFEVLEKIVLDDLSVILERMNHLPEMVSNQQQKPRRNKQGAERARSLLNEELMKIQHMKRRIYKDYSEDMLSKNEYLTYRQEYLDKEKLLTKKINTLDQQQEEEEEADILQNPWIQHLLSVRRIEELDRSIVTEMIHKISVYENNHIKIIYKFTDELQTFYALSHQEQHS